jgi:hypothetical protein
MSAITTPQNFIIHRGKTFSRVIRYEAPPILYRAITAIDNSAPVKIRAPAHGIPDGWRVAIVSLRGMDELKNTKFDSVTGAPLVTHQATVVDVDNITLNNINASEYTPYSDGGYVQFNSPVGITGFSARMSIKDVIGGTELLRLDSTLISPQPRIVLDAAAYTITLTISATDTAAIAWLTGVYDLELVSGSGVVTELLTGSVTVIAEVTTT